MEYLKNMKINVEGSFGNRTNIVNTLLQQGYVFGGDSSVYNDAKALFTYNTGIIMKTDDLEYFRNHPNAEYVLNGDNFVMVSEWFKQPATKLSFVQTGDAEYTAKYEPFATAGMSAADVRDAFMANLKSAKPLFTVETNEQIIEKQKDVADKILDKLFPIDPFAICAGGAPRDWHFGKPAAADIDIFFHTGVEQLTIVAEMLRHVGININNGQSGDNLPEWYKLNPNLKAVFGTTVDGVDVQIMVMEGKTQDTVVPQFTFSICKAWYKHGMISLDKDFKNCEKHKIVVQTNKLYSDEHKYVQKIKAKFPDYQFFDTWEQAYKYVFEKGVCDGF